MTEHAGVEYQVESMRESLIGGKFSPDNLQRLLNERAAQGWRLQHMFKADIKGRIGPGGVEGIIVVFEREKKPVEPLRPLRPSTGPIDGPNVD